MNWLRARLRARTFLESRSTCGPECTFDPFLNTVSSSAEKNSGVTFPTTTFGTRLLRLTVAGAHRCVEAMTAVGAFYEDQTLQFMEQDTEEAFVWFSKAAKLGEVDAMVRLGMMYDVGVPPAECDMVMANKLFTVGLSPGSENGTGWVVDGCANLCEFRVK